MERIKILILIFGCFLSVICLRDKNEEITIIIRKLYDNFTGKKGTLVIEVEESTLDIKIPQKILALKLKYQMNLIRIKLIVDSGRL